MADDHGTVAGETALGRVEDVLDHRSPGDLVQHLGQLRLHPGALAGGEDDDVVCRSCCECSARSAVQISDSRHDSSR